MKNKILFLGILVLVVGMTTATASAGVLSTSGMTVNSPPTSVARGMVESDETIFLFYEQQGVVLNSDLQVDISAPGIYGEPNGGTIPAGTCVNSYFIHFDLVSDNFFRDGSVLFEEEVIGLILSNELLDVSDFLGAPGTFYPKFADGEKNWRGTEVPSLDFDSVTLSADLKTVSTHLIVNNNWMDQIRVITQGACEPEPQPPGCDLITSGVTVIFPPTSVARGMVESDETIFVYCEKRDVSLNSDLQVDISAPGIYGEPNGGTIPAGTCVNSYFIHFDLVSDNFFRDGSVLFEEEVIGLILSNELLDVSDFLGAPGTFYPKFADGEKNWRGTEVPSLDFDSVTLSADLKTVSTHLIVNNNWMDQIRVITQSACEPEVPEVIEVEIDIKPNSDPSCFNSNGVGVIPLAILGSEEFNVKEIDVEMLELDGAPVTAKPDSDKLMFSYEDYNHDGYKDLMVKFVDTAIYSPEDEWATLTGYLKDGTPIMGIGDICITQ